MVDTGRGIIHGAVVVDAERAGERGGRLVDGEPADDAGDGVGDGVGEVGEGGVQRGE